MCQIVIRRMNRTAGCSAVMLSNFTKNMALAHDAATSGERISAEAYTQFADHYFRLHQAAVGVAESKRQQDQVGTLDADASKPSDVNQTNGLGMRAVDSGGSNSTSVATKLTPEPLIRMKVQNCHQQKCRSIAK